MTLKLSVIIVNFNSEKFLLECLKSIEKSSLPMDNFEVIVIDNASNDNSMISVPQKFPAVKFIKLEHNIGFARANNLAIKKARGEYILILNPDTVIPSATFKTILKFLDKNPQTAVVTARLNLADGTLDDACHRGFPTPWNAFCYFSGFASLFPNSRIFNGYHLGFTDLNKVHEIDSCVGAFMMVRKSAGTACGWFDESYFWYGEDLDFCYRVKKMGWQIIYLPQASITHYKGVSSGLKKHSLHLSSADLETKIRATRARFEVMRIFYHKHYQKGFYKLLTPLIFSGIKIKEWLSEREYRD